MLLEKLRSFRKWLLISIIVNVLWIFFLILFFALLLHPTMMFLTLTLFLICTIASYVIAVVNGVKSLEFQKHLPMNTPAYSDAGTIKILGIICIVVGGRILDIVLFVLAKKLIDEISNNPVYTVKNETGPFPQQTYQGIPQNQSEA